MINQCLCNYFWNVEVSNWQLPFYYCICAKMISWSIPTSGQAGRGFILVTPGSAVRHIHSSQKIQLQISEDRCYKLAHIIQGSYLWFCPLFWFPFWPNLCFTGTLFSNLFISSCISGVTSENKNKGYLMIWCVTSLLTLFEPYWDKEEAIMRQCNKVPNSHELNSASSKIRTRNQVISINCSAT